MKIEIWTTGVNVPSSSRGAWCAILLAGEREKVVFDWTSQTTHNRMGLMGVIGGLFSLSQPDQDVRLYTDSAYVVNPFTKGWKPHTNFDLWSFVLRAAKVHDVRFELVTRDQHHQMNERCIDYANLALHQKRTID